MLMDYPNRRRLKINALAEFKELKDDADLARRLASLGYKASSSTRSCSGLNCPQHITPCSREPELAQALDPVRYHLRPGRRDEGVQSRRFQHGERGEQLRTRSG